MKKFYVLIVAGWCVLIAATGSMGQSAAIQATNVTNGVQLLKGYTRYGKTESSGDSYTRIGKVPETCGPPNYCAYSGSSIASWPTVPSMGSALKNGAVFYDTSLPSAHPSPVARCTDQAIEPDINIGNQSKSAGLGGSGDAEQLFNTNSTLLRFNTSGNAGHITLFNPATLVCGDPGTGHAITGDKNLTTPGSAGGAFNFGGGTFSWTDPSVYFGGSTKISKYTINTRTGSFTVQDQMDFTKGYPYGTLAPAWQAGQSYALGDYVSYTLSGLPDWSGSTSFVLGDLIKPTTNNPLNCAFKLSSAGIGTRGTQPATWSTTGSCTMADVKTEGGGTLNWRNIGNGGSFTYQLTAGSGTSSAFVVSGHPDLMSTVTDGGMTWTNTGTFLTPRWSSFAGVSKDSTRFCSAISSNAYGTQGYIPDGTWTTNYNRDNGGQGTGIYVECYDSRTNKFTLLNTATRIQSVVTCSGASDYGCTGGTQSKLTAVDTAPLSVGALFSGCSFYLHNAKGGSTLNYVVIPTQGGIPLPSAGTGCNGSMPVWKPFAAYDRNTTLQFFNTDPNHWTLGDRIMANVGQSPKNFGYNTGAYTIILDAENPGVTGTTSWQPTCGSSPLPPCGFGAAYDSHMAWWHSPSNDDSGPICGTVYNYATLDPAPVAPWQGEEVCVTTSSTWRPGDSIPAGAKVWRFTHTFSSGGNPFFDTQFGISQLSQDGKFLAFSSDWNCSLGDTSGNATSMCGPPWVGGKTYATGQKINPFASTGGSGTNYGLYEVTSGGTAAASKPAWFVCNGTTAGNTVTDANGVVYTCRGSANGKGEVFVVGLK